METLNGTTAHKDISKKGKIDENKRNNKNTLEGQKGPPMQKHVHNVQVQKAMQGGSEK